jgi:acetolactate synthase-1/2/3 large subunit
MTPRSCNHAGNEPYLPDAMTRCGELIIRTLEAHGVDTVFGIPGNHTLELYRGLADSPIRHITPRHEQGAAFMADGYARATGRPGVCLLISGPGLTNAATPIAQARADSVPLLVLTSVAATDQLGRHQGRLHELPDQHGLASRLCLASHTLLHVDDVPRVIGQAFESLARDRPGPIHIEVPLDVLAAPADHVALTLTPYADLRAPIHAKEASRIVEAAQRLDRASRPLLLLGGGAVSAAAHLPRLAEQLDAPVLNTVNAKGLLPPEHPLAVHGSPSLQCLRNALADADVVLALGTEFGETDYDLLMSGPLEIGGELIRIDIDAEQLTRNATPAIGIEADTRWAAKALLDVLSRLDKGGADRAASLRSEVAQEPHVHPEFGALFAAIDTALPDAIVVGDSTRPTYYASWQWVARQPRSYFHSVSGFGTLGYALPAALGAKVACPERPVIALIGDGGIQFSLPELASGVAAELPVAVILWDNNGYQEIRNSMEGLGIAPIGTDLGRPDFMGIAEAYGCHARRVTDLDSLSEGLLAAAGESVPTVLLVREEDLITTPSGQWY